MKLDPKFNDPKFQRWLGTVSPTGEVQPVLDIIAIVELLYMIFKLLVEMGCIQKAIATRQVRSRIKMSDVEGTVKRLEEFRDYLVARNQGEHVKLKSIFLALLAFAPLALNAEPVYVGLEKPKQVYSKRFKRHYWLGLKKHLLQTEGQDEGFKLADVKVPNLFFAPSKWPLPPQFPLNQKNCGSCVVFAATGSATYQLYTRGLMTANVTPLSQGQVMNCNPRAGQCSGDWAENVGAWMVSQGSLLSANDYPYTPRDGSCQNRTGQKFGPIKSGRVIDGSDESIGKALVQAVFPLTTIGAGGAFMDYDGGEFKSCQNIGTNHEMFIVGIQCRGAAAGADGYCNFAAAKPGDILLAVMNSWDQWGDKGVIWMPHYASNGRRCNNVGEEVYAFDTGPMPDPKPPTPDPDPKPPTPDSGVPAWVLIVGALALVVGLIVYLVKKK